MAYVMKIMSRADGVTVSETGLYVRGFDHEHDDGRGKLVVCERLENAMTWEDQADALVFWKRQSTVHPIRLWDGEPNRPMTAYTVEVIEA